MAGSGSAARDGRAVARSRDVRCASEGRDRSSRWRGSPRSTGSTRRRRIRDKRSPSPPGREPARAQDRSRCPSLRCRRVRTSRRPARRRGRTWSVIRHGFPAPGSRAAASESAETERSNGESVHRRVGPRIRTVEPSTAAGAPPGPGRRRSRPLQALGPAAFDLPRNHAIRASARRDSGRPSSG